MKPSKKAKELVERYLDSFGSNGFRGAVHGALICVDELIEQWCEIWTELPGDCDYWNDVRKEIEKL